LGFDPAVGAKSVCVSQGTMNSEMQFRLLVCDPDPQGQKVIRECLQDSSIKVLFTSSAEPFENTLAKHFPFDAVMIDLPTSAKRSCGKLVSAVKRIAPSAEVIFLSRLADEELWGQVLSLGAYDLLSKPLERTEFLRTVSGVVRHDQVA
jgi:DNA-binding NtrC family response regulator